MAHNRTPMADVADDDTFWNGTPEELADKLRRTSSSASGRSSRSSRRRTTSRRSSASSARSSRSSTPGSAARRARTVRPGLRSRATSGYGARRCQVGISTRRRGSVVTRRWRRRPTRTSARPPVEQRDQHGPRPSGDQACPKPDVLAEVDGPIGDHGATGRRRGDGDLSLAVALEDDRDPRPIRGPDRQHLRGRVRDRCSGMIRDTLPVGIDIDDVDLPGDAGFRPSLMKLSCVPSGDHARPVEVARRTSSSQAEVEASHRTRRHRQGKAAADCVAVAGWPRNRSCRPSGPPRPPVGRRCPTRACAPPSRQRPSDGEL